MKYDVEVKLNPKTRPILLCVPIYFDDGYYPSAGNPRRQRLVYWQTIAVLCASVRRSKTPQLDILICTNESPPPEIAGILNRLGAKFAMPEFSFRPPRGLFLAFSGSFYLFDCMDYCRRTYPSQMVFVFIDPDCIVFNDLDALRQYSDQWPLIGYELAMDKDTKENGCSRNDLLAFLQGLAPSHPPRLPAYFGGELLVVSGEELPGLCDKIDRIWAYNLRTFKAGGNTLKTEEHIISAAFALSEGLVGNANVFIKRMWTRPSFRNVSPADQNFSIWHLPAEKLHAFPAMFHRLKRDSDAFTGLNDSDFRAVVSQQVRLRLPLLERAIYVFYPLLKRLASLAFPTDLQKLQKRGEPATLRGEDTWPSPLGPAVRAENFVPVHPYTAVVVATKDRPQALNRLLDSLQHQTVRPDTIIVSACSPGDVDEKYFSANNIQVLFGPPNLPAQRNRALVQIRQKAEIVIFFDDDFIPSRFWIERVQMLLKNQPEIGGVTGRVLADGVKSTEITWATGQSIVTEADDSVSPISIDDRISTARVSPYGCNMAFRASAIQNLEFDERLVLYGWLEDRDFGSRAARRSRMAFTDRLWGVHLGASNGRTSGLRFGYSQVVNPWYLKKKGTMEPLDVHSYIVRALVKNTLGTVFRSSEIDRWGRLKGNLIGLMDILRSRWAPERISQL